MRSARSFHAFVSGVRMSLSPSRIPTAATASGFAIAKETRRSVGGDVEGGERQGGGSIGLDFTDNGGLSHLGTKRHCNHIMEVIATIVSAKEMQRSTGRDGGNKSEREREGKKKNSQDPNESDMAVAVA